MSALTGGMESPPQTQGRLGRPMVEGTVVLVSEDTMVQDTMVEGIMVQDTMVEGIMVEGTVVQDTMVEGEEDPEDASNVVRKDTLQEIVERRQD